MATRLRKTRRLRGGRNMGWGQIGQHRASGHKGGLGIAGLHKYHFSTLLKDMPDHFGPFQDIVEKFVGLLTKMRDLSENV